MTIQEMVAILHKERERFDAAAEALLQHEVDKARTLLSGHYVMGYGRVVDELRRLGQDTCEHEWRLEAHAGKVCFKRCWKCHLQQEVARV